MLASITPLGERGRGRRWGVTAGSYLLGSVAGGVGLGWLFGLLGGVFPSRDPRMSYVLVVLLLLLAAAADGRRAPIPSSSRQVSEDWLDEYRGWVVGLGFGLQLGLGVVTIVTTATVYLVPVMAALSGSATSGAVVGGAFGLARALPILFVRRVNDPSDLRAVHLRFQRLAVPARAVSVLALVTMAALAGFGLT